MISEPYLGGEDILFPDSRATLDAEVSNLCMTADVFDPLTDWLHIKPLTLNELVPDSSIVHARVDRVIHLARANALVCCSDLRKFKDSLEQVFRSHSSQLSEVEQ